MSAELACKYHPNAILIEDYQAGDIICQECGLVVGDRVISCESEYRHITDDNNPTKWSSKERTGTIQSSRLTDDLTTMDTYKIDQQKHQQQQATHNRSNMVMHVIYSQLNSLSSVLNVSPGVERSAKQLIEKACKPPDALIKQKTNNVNMICSAALFVACRVNEEDRQPDEFGFARNPKFNTLVSTFGGIYDLLVPNKTLSVRCVDDDQERLSTIERYTTYLIADLANSPKLFKDPLITKESNYIVSSINQHQFKKMANEFCVFLSTHPPSKILLTRVGAALIFSLQMHVLKEKQSKMCLQPDQQQVNKSTTNNTNQQHQQQQQQQQTVNVFRLPIKIIPFTPQVAAALTMVIAKRVGKEPAVLNKILTIAGRSFEDYFISEPMYKNIKFNSQTATYQYIETFRE